MVCRAIPGLATGDAETLRHECIPTVEFSFGTQTAQGTVEHTTSDALGRNATAYALFPCEYDKHVPVTS